MKIALIAGVTPVSLGSVEQTAAELTELITACRNTGDTSDFGAPVSAREVAEIAHRSSAGLVAVVQHPSADPALLLGVLVATGTPVSGDDTAELRAHLAKESSSDIREVVEGRSPLGYPAVFAERIVTAAQLHAGEPFDCQLQAAVADPHRPRVAVFTLTSGTGRGWPALSAMFGRLIASVDFSVT